MNDENRARIALIKARIAELEDGEFAYGPYIGNTTTPTRGEKEQRREREGEEEETEGTETEMQEHKNEATPITTAQTQTYGKKRNNEETKENREEEQSRKARKNNRGEVNQAQLRMNKRRREIIEQQPQ